MEIAGNVHMVCITDRQNLRNIKENSEESSFDITAIDSYPVNDRNISYEVKLLLLCCTYKYANTKG